MEFNKDFRIVGLQDSFARREVGVTHPGNDAYIRVSDSGHIEIVSHQGLGILVSPDGSTIRINANQIRFITKEGGLYWNGRQVNPHATSFDEPFLSPQESSDRPHLYSGVET